MDAALRRRLSLIVLDLERLELEGYTVAGAWLAARSLRFPRTVTGTAISVGEVRRLHALAVGPAWARYPPRALVAEAGPGRFRRSGVQPWSNVRPPAWPLVERLVTRWVAKANRLAAPAPLRDAMTPLAELHCEFERIHPFRDGNGRAGRLALNLLLARHGLPTVTIPACGRDEYYDALATAGDGDPGPLRDVLLAHLDETRDAGRGTRPLAPLL